MLQQMRTTFGCIGLMAVLQLTVPCYGQQAGHQAPGRTVTGTVINAATALPIRHALVQIFSNSQPAVLTGPDGRFQVDNVPEGRMMLFAQKPGFFDANSLPGTLANQTDREVTVGSGKNDFRVTLYPAARIAGRVIDADGEAAENIFVQVLKEQIVEGRKLLLPQNGAMTDDDGSYRIEGLMPGRYKVFANGHLLPSPNWDAPPEVSAPVYYPNSRDLTSAQAIEIKPGQESRADFHLHSERAFRIAGTFGGVPDKVGVGFTFENGSGQNVTFGPVNLDPSKGQFGAQAVPSGTWTLVLSASDSQGTLYEARQEIVVDGADITDLQFLLHPLASIPVKVNHTANGVQPVPAPGFPDIAVNASLSSVEPFRERGYGPQAQGSPPVLAFTNVAAGKYKLNVEPFGSECLESARYGSIDLTREYLVIGSSGETQPLIINLRADCATLSVKLRSEEQPRTGFVLVVPSSSMAAPKLLTIAAQSPNSGIDRRPVFNAARTLSPGSYQVFAFATIDGLEYTNPEALLGYPSQTVNLEPGQKAELTVVLSERKGN